MNNIPTQRRMTANTTRTLLFDIDVLLVPVSIRELREVDDLLPEIFCLEYKPVPGMLVFKYVPFFPIDIFAPLGPMEVLTPPLLRFK